MVLRIFLIAFFSFMIHSPVLGQVSSGIFPSQTADFLNSIIERFDLDGDGQLNDREVTQAVKTAKEIDKNGDGKFSRDEIVTQVIKATQTRGVSDQAATETMLKVIPVTDDFAKWRANQILLLFDKDHNDELNKEEIVASRFVAQNGLITDADKNGILTRKEIENRYSIQLAVMHEALDDLTDQRRLQARMSEASKRPSAPRVITTRGRMRINTEVVHIRVGLIQGNNIASKISSKS